MADVMTYEEHRGSIDGRTVAWSGDANNVARSWVHAAVRFGFGCALACPQPTSAARGRWLEWARGQGGDVLLTRLAAAGGRGRRSGGHRHLVVDGDERGGEAPQRAWRPTGSTRR